MKNLTIIALLVMCISTQAQNNSFVSVFGGLTSPSGNWTKTAYNANGVGAWNPDDADNLSSGFAGSGTSFGIEGAWFFSKYFGVGGLASYSTFNFTGLDALSTGYQASLDVDSVATSVGPGYKMGNFMCGIYFSYPITDKFSVTAKVLGGLTTVTTPSIAVHVWDGGRDDSTFTQHSCTSNSFGYAAGIGVGYKVLSYLEVNLQASYFYSKPDFFFDNTYFNTNVVREVPEYNQPLTYMSFTLGLAYSLGKK